MAGLEDFFGPPIHVYTRADAIADGMLKDITADAAEAGFTLHTVMTLPFRVLRVPREGRGVQPRYADLVLHVGPGDDAEPVLTIMRPGED